MIAGHTDSVTVIDEWSFLEADLFYYSFFKEVNVSNPFTRDVLTFDLHSYSVCDLIKKEIKKLLLSFLLNLWFS